jgi:very-short-patch-repair endonuclease
MKGKKLSSETKKKMSNSHRGLEPWNKGKTFEELYKKEKADNIKKRMSENYTPRKKHPNVKLMCLNCNKNFEVEYKHRNSKFCCHKCSTDFNIGKKMPYVSDETRKKMSLAKQGYKRKQSNKERKNRRLLFQEKFNDFDNWHPNFNPKACDYFEKFDKENNTSGQHARNGGEFHIKELGYWVDYINHDLKLIIEWDEEKHFTENKLIEKDIIRQQEIQELYPDYEFRRIRENEFNGN